MSFIINHYGKNIVEIHTARYVSGDLCVDLVHDGERYATISVFLPELTLANDEFAFKTYTENVGLYQQLFDQSAIEFIRMEPSTLGMIPICRLTQT